MEFWIWVVIAIVVAVVKALGKLQSAAEEEPIPVPPKPQPQRPPRTRPRPSAAPPQATPAPVGGWRADPEHLREFITQLTRQAQPPPIVPAAAREARKPEPKPEPQPKQQTAPAQVTEHKPSRAAQWAAAVRDKHNLRNIVIATEIIGPPKGA